MSPPKSKTSLPLEPVAAAAAEQLPQSEYLVDRHSIQQGEHYESVTVRAKWLAEYETISVEVVFIVTAAQWDAMKANIDDETVRDDIDSGVGELFEGALQELYPEHEWGCSIGEVKLKCRKSK